MRGRLRSAKPTPQELEARLRGLVAASAELARQGPVVAAAELERAERAQHHAGEEAETGELHARAEADEEIRKAAAAALPAVGRAVGRLAPGLASMRPDAAEWRSREFIGTGMPTCLRVGVLNVPGDDEIPAVPPLVGTAGWCVVAKPARLGHQVLQNAAMRLVGCAEPLQVRIDTYDPRLASSMGLLGNLTTKAPNVVPSALDTDHGLRDLLSGLVATSASRGSRLAQLGFDNFAEMLRENSGISDPYRVVVLFDYPAGVDSRAQSELVRLAANAASRGMIFLVHHDPSITPEHGVVPEELTERLDSITVAEDEVRVGRLPGPSVRLDPPFEPDRAAAICDLVAELSERAVLPTTDFTDTLPDEAQRWQPVRDELTTVIGYDDRTPAVIRLRSGNPPLPHVLVGGAVGQGKSNLLLVLIHGLAVRYSPDDLEMYLLDFKHGLEFSALGPSEDREHWLPHVKVLGVHSDRTFGLATLRHLADELTRRSDVFKRAGNIADIADMPPGPSRPPRTVVVLDEFHVLLQEDDDLAEEAARLIERLARLGRAYGLHLVLATQTIEGVQRLAIRKDAIFGQVPYRIALKSTPSDSQAVLRTGNSAGADLKFRGEAILNANFGSPDDNQRVLVSFADNTTLDQLRHDLWVKSGDRRPPRIFHTDEPALLADVPPPEPTGAPTPATGPGSAWIGMPIAVDEDPVTVELRDDPGSGLLVLGDGPRDALGVLSAAAVSAARSQVEPPLIVVLDGVTGDQELAEDKAALVETLQGLGCDVEVVAGVQQVHDRLFDLRDLCLGDGPSRRTYLVGLGLHAVPRMTAYPDGRFESPADALQEIVREGPAKAVSLLGWWNRLHVCTEHLGWGRCNVGAHVFLQHPQDGVRSVCGPLVRWDSERHRGLLWDGLSSEPETFVPFAPITVADVERLTEGIRR